MEEPIISIKCFEKKTLVQRNVYPLIFTPENLQKFWNHAKEYDVLFGKRLHSISDFNQHFFTERNGQPWLTGLFWVVDDFVGVFYLTEIFEHQADAHFTFFDKRLHGREELTRSMMKYVFEQFPTFTRLNVTIPCYVSDKVFQFVDRVGFKAEGRKRKTSMWKGKWFDSVLYGVLREELITGVKDGSDN